MSTPEPQESAVEAGNAADTPLGAAPDASPSTASDHSTPGFATTGSASSEQPAELASCLASCQSGCRRGDRAWYGEIMSRVDARDWQLSGVKDLYFQYDELLRNHRTIRGTGQGQPSEPAASGYEASGAETRLAHELKLKEQELDAAHTILRERDEEMSEKEEAQRDLSTQATKLGQENQELRAQIQRAEDLLQAKSAEAARLAVEMQKLRESSDQARGQAGEGDRGGGKSSPSLPPELPNKRQLHRKIHEAELTCIAGATTQNCSPLPTSLIAVGTADGFVKLVDGDTLKSYAHLTVCRQNPKIVVVDLSHGNGLLLAACADNNLRLLDLPAQRLQHTMRGHADALSACGFFQGYTKAFTASRDRTVKLWDLTNGQTLRSLPASGPVTAAGTHNSSGIIVTGHEDGSLSVFDPRASDALVSALSSPSPIHEGNSIAGVRLSPDGTSVLSQAENGATVALTALGTMGTLLSLPGLGPVSGPSSPAFSSDGLHALARGSDGICCWRISDGEKVCNSDSAQTVCVSWDLPSAVTAHRDGHVSLWGAADAD